jgi:CheY-like chemotaxis protein
VTRILLVEDNPANQLLSLTVLEQAGFTVDVAESAVEVIRRLRANRPDIILMDVQLPGQDGLSLTRELKADPSYSSIPIVALTGHAMIGDREEALAAGCTGHITKPIDIDVFADQVREFLKLTPTTRRPRVTS